MPTGSATFDAYSIPLDSIAWQIVVYRYDSSRAAGSRQGTALPNVRMTGLQWQDGPRPQSARFEYVFDDSDPDTPYPIGFEEVWPLNASNPYAVLNDDELYVVGYDQNGDPHPLFHGFALIPQVDISRHNEVVTFTAVGVAVRLWDKTIGGARWRQSDEQTSQLLSDTVLTDLPTHFNPFDSMHGNTVMRANCTPDGSDLSEGTDFAYPVFLDPFVFGAPIPQTYWTLGKMARYLIQEYNYEEEWVTNPTASEINSLLECYTPKSGEFFDPNNSATYDNKPILVRDFNATNMAWPDALYEQIQPHGFSFYFALESDENGEPETFLFLYRKDAKTLLQPKSLRMQPTRSVLNPGKTNIEEFHAARDNQPIANEWSIETTPVQYEISVVLAPDFHPVAGDAADLTTWTRSNLNNDPSADNHDKYRRYVANEDGTGYWDFASSSLKQTPVLDLSEVLGDPVTLPDGTQEPAYVKRTRPGSSTLLSRDASGRPYRAQLAVSRDYTGPSTAPHLWAGTGTWQSITGGWELLPDRLGIYVTCEQPEAWSIGKSEVSGMPAPDGKLQGVTSQANPSATVKRFYLRLTTVIEGDRILETTAEKRPSSPTKFTIARRVSASDHFTKHVIGSFSQWNVNAQPREDQDIEGNDLRDDTESAKVQAKAYRTAHEIPPLGGQVTIPWLCLAYTLGDRIDWIEGRNISLQTNLGENEGEGPTYPWIEGISFSFSQDSQVTQIQLADYRPAAERNNPVIQATPGPETVWTHSR